MVIISKQIYILVKIESINWNFFFKDAFVWLLCWLLEKINIEKKTFNGIGIISLRIIKFPCPTISLGIDNQY